MIQSLTRDELLALLGAAQAHSRRNWLALLLAYTYGYRASEVVALTPANIRGEFLDVQRLKRSRRTVQRILGNPEPLLDLKPALFEYVAKFTRNQRLFPFGRRWLWKLTQRYAKAAGVPVHKAHPHILKHTIALELVPTAGVHNTQIWLGHQSGASTLIYTEVSDEDAEKAVRAALGV